MSKNFRQYLQVEFIKRCKKNKNYSLRSFARQLDVDPSTLSKILKNKIHPGSRLIFRISKKLDIPEEEVTFFFQDLKKQQNNSYEKIALDTFAVISDWQHFAILELMKIEDFQPQAEWISHKLGLSLSETEKSIQRLFDLELILLDDQGQ